MARGKDHLTLLSVSGYLIRKRYELPDGFFKTRTVSELKELIAREVVNLPPNRIKLQQYHRPIPNDKTLKEVGIKSEDTILIKDMGPQVSWKLVFILEYLGPILVHLVVYLNRNAIFWFSSPQRGPTAAQKITFICVMIHFIKRELETFFVHIFSNQTMPLRNLRKNCAYYTFLLGFYIALSVYSPRYTGGLKSPLALLIFLCIWIYAQASNFYTHWILRSIRTRYRTAREVPHGYGFDLVCCPNYFFEILGWTALTIISGSFSVAVCTLIGGIQMFIWAKKKHLDYKKEFGKNYPRRKILIPYLL